MTPKIPDESAARRNATRASDAARIRETLADAGIHAWGSDELQRYERNLTRYFSREYRNLAANSAQLAELRQSSAALPMAEETERLMDEHYDEPLALFERFLDRRYMAYTMAWFGEDAAACRSNAVSLEQAQSAKFALAAERIGLCGNERILNIGCGFGSLETWLFERHPDVQVVSITPSKVQAAYIRKCMADPAHPIRSDRLRIVEKTFEQMTAEEPAAGQFDLVFSFGMFEHVANLDAALSDIHDCLRPGGRCFIDLIVSKPVFLQHMDADRTLIGRYFPGGRVWPYDALPLAAGKLEVTGHWFLNGTNYWLTLDHWHRNFWDNIETLHPAVLDAPAVKHWNDYFVLCKAVLFGPLDGDTYGDGYYVFRRRD